MDKYKQGTKSIPISNIPKEDLLEAFMEFSNGNEAMAELLMNCYKHGVETSGNHVGPNSYLDFVVNNSQKDIKNIIKSVQDFKDFQVLVTPDGGNPFSGEEFYKPVISVGFRNISTEQEGNELYKKMSGALINNNDLAEEIGVFDSMLDFHDFFAGRGTDLIIRAKHENGKYTLAIENTHNKRNVEYFKELFEKAGLTYVQDTRGEEWRLVSDKPEVFKEMITQAEKTIESNWILDKPTQITEDMSMCLKAKLKMEEFGSTPEGTQKFKEWLSIEKEAFKAWCKKIEMKYAVSNAINSGISSEQIEQIDKVENEEITKKDSKENTNDEQ